MVSKRLVVFACIAMTLGIGSAHAVHANNIIILANESSRTQQSAPDTNVHATTLTVRAEDGDLRIHG